MILFAFSSLLEIDIEKHEADTADGYTRSRHIQITEIESQDLGKERHGIHPESGNIADERTDVAQESHKTDRSDHYAQKHTHTFFHNKIRDRIRSSLLSDFLISVQL